MKFNTYFLGAPTGSEAIEITTPEQLNQLANMAPDAALVIRGTAVGSDDPTIEMAAFDWDGTVPQAMPLWVVGDGDCLPRSDWLVAIRSTKERALAVCDGHPRYFIGPVPLDGEPVHEKNGPWPGCYYPAYQSAGDES